MFQEENFSGMTRAPFSQPSTFHNGTCPLNRGLSTFSTIAGRLIYVAPMESSLRQSQSILAIAWRLDSACGSTTGFVVGIQRMRRVDRTIAMARRCIDLTWRINTVVWGHSRALPTQVDDYGVSIRSSYWHKHFHRLISRLCIFFAKFSLFFWTYR